MVTIPQGIQNPAYRRSRPTFCISKTASCGRQIAGLRFSSNSGVTLSGLDTTCPGNSKSLANLLCVCAVPDDARARTVRQCRFPRPNLCAADSEGRSAWRSEGRQRGRSGTGQSTRAVGCGPPGTSLAARSFRRGGGRESHPAAGRQAIGSLELTRHVALVGEAGRGSGARE
jgi:hypothetical protein